MNDADATTALCRRAAQLASDEAARESLCGACAAVLKSAPSDEAFNKSIERWRRSVRPRSRKTRARLRTGRVSSRLRHSSQAWRTTRVS